VIKLRRIRWIEHVARMGTVVSVRKMLAGRTTGRDHLGELGIDGMIILKQPSDK
jgi:hypothetical protein